MPTKQETFDTVARHLLTQKAQSLLDDVGKTCAYRGTNGLKCAVGALLPDELYHPSLEGTAAASRPVRPLLEQLGHCPLLCEELQSIHDNFEPANWPERLETLAVEHGISTAVIDELAP